MDVSVIIPTRGRPRKVATCVRALARQTLEPDRYEILLGLDGRDPDTLDAVEQAGAETPDCELRVVTCQRNGYNAVRNELLPLCRGRTLVSLNDDVRPVPECLAAHLGEQHRAPAIVVGHSPWVRYDDDRLFDRLVRETSMVFFFHRMDTTDPDRDWGFRHAWGLNASMPLDAVREVGGWTAFPREYGYDDIELAWRLRRRFSLSVLYRPRAQAFHDHRFAPREYLHREFRLGRSAWLFARRNPELVREVLGRDITSPDELSYCQAFVRRERPVAARAMHAFLDLDAMPWDVPDALVGLIYEQHVPLKRWMWRAGLLAAARSRPVEDAVWPDSELTRQTGGPPITATPGQTRRIGRAARPAPVRI